MAVPALVYRLAAGLLLTVTALGLALVPVPPVAMAIPVAPVAVGLVAVRPVTGVLARVAPAPSCGVSGSRVGADAVARHDGGGPGGGRWSA
jgi:hypothetical protein